MPASLKGLSILITRPRAQAIELAGHLEELGAEPIVLPSIEIVPLYEAAPEGVFDWIVFTSVNGVEVFTERYVSQGAKIAAIGSATAAALGHAGWPVHAIPTHFVSDEIADHLGDVTDKRILLVRGDRARTRLPEILEQRRAKIEHAVVYRIVDVEREVLAEALERLKERGLPDAIAFTSPSAVQALVGAAERAWLRTIPIVCIGPVTAEAVSELGFEPAVVAEEFTIPGLVEALTRWEACVA